MKNAYKLSNIQIGIHCLATHSYKLCNNKEIEKPQKTSASIPLNSKLHQQKLNEIIIDIYENQQQNQQTTKKKNKEMNDEEMKQNVHINLKNTYTHNQTVCK